ISCHRGVRPSPPYHHPQREDIGDSDHREYHSRSLPGIVYIDYFVLRKIKYDARIRAPTAICPRRAGGPSGGVGGLGLGCASMLPPPLLPLSPTIAPTPPLPVQALLPRRPHTSLPDNLRLLQELLPAA